MECIFSHGNYIHNLQLMAVVQSNQQLNEALDKNIEDRNENVSLQK